MWFSCKLAQWTVSATMEASQNDVIFNLVMQGTVQHWIDVGPIVNFCLGTQSARLILSAASVSNKESRKSEIKSKIKFFKFYS